MRAYSLLLTIIQTLQARRWLTLLVAVAIELAVLVPLGLLLPPRHILGIPGSLIAVVAVVTGALSGPLAGFLASASGAIVFFLAVSHVGETSSGPTVVLSATLWTLCGVISGLIADALRHNAAARQELTVALAKEEEAARAHETSARLAAGLTAGLLPQIPSQHGSLEIHTFYEPGDLRLGLGGDFMDVISLPDGTLALILGDVAGHGPEAAALGTGLRASWRALAVSGSPPDVLMDTLNSLVFLHRQPDMFATACVAWINPAGRRATIISAGHPRPLLLSRQPRDVDITSSPPLGVQESAVWHPGTLALPPSWTLFFYTDGLIEGRARPHAAERFGQTRLIARLSGDGSTGLDRAALERLVAEITQANGPMLPDDVAVLVIHDGGGRAA